MTRLTMERIVLDKEEPRSSSTVIKATNSNYKFSTSQGQRNFPVSHSGMDKAQSRHL